MDLSFFIVRAPHRGQKRESITLATPKPYRPFARNRRNPAGIRTFLHAGRFHGARCRRDGMRADGGLWMAAWTSVAHLGRQFRVYAGLYHDHALVKTGPYAIVRHPIYASLFAMLLATLLFLAPWQWMIVPIAVYILGTEIRVRCEDGLLRSRFGEEFERYRKAVPAYIPFVR